MPDRETRILRYYLLHKPYGVLCQFSDHEGRPTLGSLGKFPPDVYPAGRLDNDSEGLVLLTNDGTLKHLLLDPQYGHPRTYLVQVERIPDEASMEKLRGGLLIEGRRTRPADAVLLEEEPGVPPRTPPIRYRRNIPTAWIELTLHEGRNRQVRRMTAAVGHPTLRLIRIRIGSLRMGNLKPGGWRELTAKEIDALMALKRPGGSRDRRTGPRTSSEQKG